MLVRAHRSSKKKKFQISFVPSDKNPGRRRNSHGLWSQIFSVQHERKGGRTHYIPQYTLHWTSLGFDIYKYFKGRRFGARLAARLSSLPYLIGYNRNYCAKLKLYKIAIAEEYISLKTLESKHTSTHTWARVKSESQKHLGESKMIKFVIRMHSNWSLDWA